MENEKKKKNCEQLYTSLYSPLDVKSFQINLLADASLVRGNIYKNLVICD